MKLFRIISLLESISDSLNTLRNYILFSPKSDEMRTDHLATYTASSNAELQRVFHEIADNEVLPIQLGEYFVVKIYKRNF